KLATRAPAGRMPDRRRSERRRCRKSGGRRGRSPRDWVFVASQHGHAVCFGAVHRRRFLDALLTVGFVSTAIAIVYPVGRFLIPPASGEPAVDATVAGRAGMLRPNSAALFKFGTRPGIVLRTAD